MHINLETPDPHSIQAYSDKEITIDSINYKKSVIINRQEIISNWPITSIDQLTEELLEPLLRHQPRIIIIGHSQHSGFASPFIFQTLAKHRVGLESMSIGAACRTYNILLSEQRDVVLGVIFE
ncbi:Mth938-like domain-containing protein [Legionella fairfieldensis]|uniref:Mth938-like domain-containing protein n=1 Tax=Legionella fairfieldensis TaxID=45064 RepID=UPI0004911B81|nr:MTH938/NDUFAF3 family protein [Legionella fairfieldensis]